ncbi:hypothetical protein BU24DRAFT_481797 [Aaosphaeria arxii CBS 175.79]|uniref:Rhodopsin domain-containing protein n=1 Tax=Aaosphaeria arxii CBS 175.79 TaxID=1450172 RepID=A0A6A5XN52_9PLEO|nr:uncharacterized protein BU24DRAFT_481797 [Aaosphaeria arxii CBS 175.79]KAF2014353.1 hypothetical protein BU24DRAFT_481797 [Aaosphaeria arxii CBS 175.79]
MRGVVPAVLEQGHEAIVVGAVFAALTTFTVFLRFLTNIQTRSKFSWSEGTLLLAQILYIAEYAVQAWGLDHGTKIRSATDGRLAIYLQSIYIGALFYFPVILLTNLSILFLYRRLFPVESFKRWSAILMVCHIVWFIPSFVVQTAMCTPPSVMWQRPDLIKDKCIPYATFFIVVCSFELVLDAAILAMPCFYIVNLHLPWQRRMELLVIFLLGGLVIVTGVLRIRLSIEPGSTAIDFMHDILWLDIHAGIALVCACLPTYRPLIVKASSVVSGSVSKIFSSKDQSTDASSKPSDSSATQKHAKMSDGTIGSSPPMRKKYDELGSIDEVGLVEMETKSAYSAVSSIV